MPILLSKFMMMPDLFSHMARYHVMMHGQEDPYLLQYFQFQWKVVGNLGVDILVFLVSHVTNVELATRLVVACIPAITTLAIYRLSIFLHGHVNCGAYVALSLIYSFPFLHGFVNFTLGIALALLLFPLWVKANNHSLRVGVPVSIVISLLIWVVHLSSFAIFLIMAFFWQAYPVIAGEVRNVRDIALRVGRLSALLAPVIPTLAWRSSESVQLFGKYSFTLKAYSLGALVRSENQIFDVLSAGLILLTALVFALYPGIKRQYSLLSAGGLIFLFFLILPQDVFGSYYADSRLVPISLILILLACGPIVPRWDRIVGILGLALFVVRIGEAGLGWKSRGDRLEKDLTALKDVPQGSRIAVVAVRSLCNGWVLTSLDHAPSLAIVWKNAFTNTVWDLPGQQILKPIYNLKFGYNSVPSDLLATKERTCDGRPMEDILASLPRNRFDFVWILAPDHPAEYRPWLQFLYRGPNSRLYKIIRKSH